MNKPPLKIGTHIRNIRQSQKMTLDKLASLSGVSKSYLCQIEKNKHDPTLLILEKIAKGLCVERALLIDTSIENEKIESISFFKKFEKLSPDDQLKIKQIVEIWSK